MSLKEDGVVSPTIPEDQTGAETAVPAAEAAAPEADAKAAESSTADDSKDANERSSLLSVIQDAVKPKEVGAAAEPSAAASEAGAGAEAPKEGAEAPAEGAEADDAALPFHNHPRWKQIVAERNELRPRAESYDQITGFMGKNGLSSEEVAEGFEVMALLKSGDPTRLEQALTWFEDRTAALRSALGVDLPADIQTRLDAGEIDDATASELATTRANDALRAGREKADAEAAQRDEDRKARTDAGQAAVAAVQGWEEQIRKADPDYDKKADLVETTVRALVAQEGPPKTADEAVALTKRAYDRVTEAFRRVTPAPKPKDTTTPAGSSARTATQPATLRDAIEGALSAAA